MQQCFHMVERPFWVEKIRSGLKKRPIVWLAGVRRTGKTFICKMFKKADYFDCERPSVRKKIENEDFLDSLGRNNRLIILDEIHRLSNPAEFLKIIADHYSNLKIIATGSSSLAATLKFKDTLTGRKIRVWLTPCNSHDQQAFGIKAMKERLIFGGLPPFFMNKEWDELLYQEWLDSYWSKDIQEMFTVGHRAAFLKFFELVITQSGCIFEAQRFSAPCEVSRPTIANFLSILETTFTAQVVRPFSKRLATEIVAAPKVYCFDTGFVAFANGWQALPNEQAGVLFEHWVLNEFDALLQEPVLNYWRDKAQHEVDFIWKPRGRPPIAIECKWSENLFDGASLRSFRNRHKEGKNILVAADCKSKRQISDGPLKITVLGPYMIREWFSEQHNTP